jgi:hypothetical protein
MRVFSNVVRFCSTSPEAPSTFIEHKELRQLLDAMIHAGRLSFDKTRDHVLPFAVALNDQGKIRQLAFPEHPDRSAEETARFIETGLKTLAQQLTCKAVGFCSEVRFPDGRAIHAQIVFVLEHRDGCAYRVVIPDFLEPKHWSARRTEPRFFTRTSSFLASARG